MSQTDKRKTNRRNGFYWVKDNPYVSVTTVLSVIDKPALVYWFGKEVFNAVVLNPELLSDEREALRAPYKINKKAKLRGTAVHKLVEEYKGGNKVDPESSEFAGYYNAYKDWYDSMKFTVLDHERTVLSHEHRFAGTLDMLIQLPNGEKMIVDIKTGKDIYDEVALQLSAYKLALFEEGVVVSKTAVLLLGEDGSYKFEIMEYVPDVFLATKELYEWKNRSKLERYGYGK